MRAQIPRAVEASSYREKCGSDARTPREARQWIGWEESGAIKESEIGACRLGSVVGQQLGDAAAQALDF